MTTFLWSMVGGIVFGFIGFIIFLAAKKKLGVLLTLAVAIVCSISFIVDISLNPIKDPTLTSQMAQELDFAEMVNDYRSNEIRAKETYKDNRYRITAEVVSIDRAGLREGYSGYNVSMTIDLGGEDFSICANFQGDMKAEVMKLNIGDTLTFTGKCVAPELWYNCTIVENK